MNQAIEDRIGKRGIVDVGMPLLDVELTGDDRGGPVIAIIEDFQEVAFSLMTSPALEILDVTFALNLGWATSAEDCARRVIYQPLHAPRGDPLYHPTIVGDDFFLQSGATVSINLAPPTGR